FESECLAEMRALRAQPSAVRRMLRVAGNLHLPLARDGGRDPAADSAIGASGADGLHRSPPRDGEVADAKRLTEGDHGPARRWRRPPSTMLRMVPLPVPGRILDRIIKPPPPAASAPERLPRAANRCARHRP